MPCRETASGLLLATNANVKWMPSKSRKEEAFEWVGLMQNSTAGGSVLRQVRILPATRYPTNVRPTFPVIRRRASPTSLRFLLKKKTNTPTTTAAFHSPPPFPYPSLSSSPDDHAFGEIFICLGAGCRVRAKHSRWRDPKTRSSFGL